MVTSKKHERIIYFSGWGWHAFSVGGIAFHVAVLCNSRCLFWFNLPVKKIVVTERFEFKYFCESFFRGSISFLADSVAEQYTRDIFFLEG